MDVETTHTAALALYPLWVYKIPALVFIFAFGACVGSFVNVLIFRLPAGVSVITPPSRCPSCGTRLSWRENLPIVGWLALRGRCRHCRVAISPQYLVVELAMATLFLLLAIRYYVVPPSTPVFGSVGAEWWYRTGMLRSAPAFFALLLLIAGLVAMALIDARTFQIPIEIPFVLTVAGFVLLPLQGVIDQLLPGSHYRPGEPWAIPLGKWPQFFISVGGMAGLVVSLTLLRFGIVRYSFHDYEEYVQEDEPLADYPHARREMGVEILFLLPCLIGLLVGWLVAREASIQYPPPAIRAIGSVFAGYLVGGGLVWGIRILGTLGFGREAMGLGDVHLLAAVGAILGWWMPIPVFFIAPFFALGWAGFAFVLRRLTRGPRRELPFGPHLAVATLFVIFARPVIEWGMRWLFP